MFSVYQYGTLLDRLINKRRLQTYFTEPYKPFKSRFTYSQTVLTEEKSNDRCISARITMALAGHSNMATTQRYIDLRPGMLRNAVELV
jgi:site-specific recombinase XerD